MKRSNEIAVTKNKKQLQHFETDKQVYRHLQRTSDLVAPIMLLHGHQSKILSVQFSPSGKEIATGSHDKKILLWNAYEDCKNFGEIQTSSPILDLGWSRDNTHLYSCSCDCMISNWDIETGIRIKKYRGHKAITNSISVSKRGNEMVASVSDDGTLKIWDRNGIVKDYHNDYPLVSVAFSHDAGIVYCSGVDSTIYVSVID
jgi:Prp8 binding protein